MNIASKIADPATKRRLVVGELVGSNEGDGTHAWRGIRYAAPPVGPLRWRAPQPPAAWHGTFEALKHGPMAPQVAGLLAPVPQAQYGSMVGDEDCLFLNVFAPAFTPGAVPQGKDLRPVMVWIHGGGNAVGTSTNYDVARNLAASDGVIVVTINYRLGVLGWLTHPALQAAPGTTAEERSGNFAVLDMIAALRWVRDNIAAFGGNPECVTIFGESAGGQNVMLLLASPLAAGLFHRAIAQSPVAETVSFEEAIYGINSPLDSRRSGALEATARLWHNAGRSLDRATAHVELKGRPLQDVADFLRGLSPAQLISVYAQCSVGIYLAPRTARDGVVLPTAPLTQVFASGTWNRVPIILGSNRDEMRTFLADKLEHSRMLFGKLPLLHDRAAYQAESRYGSDAWRTVNVDEIADAMLAGGHADVWTYRFDWDEAPKVPFIRPDILLGACHGMEMSFAFRDNAGEFDIFKVYTPFNRTGRKQVAQAMGDGWTSFARDGAPTLPGGVRWHRRSSAAGNDSLLIDSARDGGLRMAELRTNMQALKQKLFASPLSADLRCRIYARVFLWAPLFRDYGDEAEYNQWCKTLGCQITAVAQRPKLEI
jgi:para-nitrobenzyl esterase